MGFAFPVNAQQNKALKHNLKHITEYIQKYEKGVPGKLLKDNETWFDKAGNIVETINYRDGKIVEHYQYQYDTDNRCIKETEVDPSGRIIKVIVYKIQNGLKTEKTVYNGNNQLLSRKTYSYETF